MKNKTVIDEYSRINEDFPFDRIYFATRKKSRSIMERLCGWWIIRISTDIYRSDGELIIKKGSWVVQQNWWREITRYSINSFNELQKDFYIPKKQYGE